MRKYTITTIAPRFAGQEPQPDESVKTETHQVIALDIDSKSFKRGVYNFVIDSPEYEGFNTVAIFPLESVVRITSEKMPDDYDDDEA